MTTKETVFPRGGVYSDAFCPACGAGMILYQGDSCFNPSGKCPECGAQVHLWLEGRSEQGNLTLEPRLGVLTPVDGGEGDAS